MIKLAVFLALASSFIALPAGSPPGHKQKLGSHRPPDVPVDEVDNYISPQHFWDSYVSSNTPAVFRGAARRSPAFEKWTDSYLVDMYPTMELRLEGKDESSSYLPRGDLGIGRDYLLNVIGYYHNSNTYVVTELPFPMYKDVHVLPCLSCGTFANRIQEVNLWVSGGGTSSILHRDAFHAINCLYNGTKDWLLIHPKYEDKIYMAKEARHEIGGRSIIDVDSVDMEEFPLIQDIHYSFLTVNAGDCLFLPGKYWHQVRSFGTHNLAVSVLFSRIKSFSGVNCEQPAYKSLDQFDVVWVYNGTGTMSMGNMDVEDLREMLLTFTDDDDDRLYRKRMLEEVEELQSTFNNNAAASAYQRFQKAFDKVLDPLGKGYVTREQLSTLTRDQLKALAVALEPPEPSNTYEFEYSLFDAADIRYIIESLAREDSLTLEQFIRAYTDKDSVFGSTKIAKDVFSVLDKEGNGHVTMEQLQDGRLEAALEPFHYYQPRDSIPERMFVHNHDEL